MTIRISQQLDLVRFGQSEFSVNVGGGHGSMEIAHQLAAKPWDIVKLFRSGLSSRRGRSKAIQNCGRQPGTEPGHQRQGDEGTNFIGDGEHGQSAIRWRYMAERTTLSS